MASNLGRQMSALIRGQQTPATPGQAKAEEIRALYKQGLRQIRGQRNTHPERKRVEIAELYATTRAALRKVQADQIKTDRETFAKLERKLFGYDLERATATDRATLDATIRDATDRAAGLRKPEDAARALHQAEQNGDTILARAIAQRAHERDWNDVLDAYLSTRPTAADTYRQAGEIYHRLNSPNGVLATQQLAAFAKPDELRGLGDKDIQSMTDPGDAAA
ncbi:hypothetical protein ACG5V6_14970 [Streptomyces chitinivorans]|uniref:Uncharacterized protein n=1 Tax=Streptomyces chitinivorans TaxID=1257027 RepID=A0ABW7HUP1_9ACTN|nr:hypothetical protein [Streptomyces chitinivorans]MDH2407182.1 hypothetical protein [Streptomyces chitinivorans]